MEPQGRNSVFAADATTLAVLERQAARMTAVGAVMSRRRLLLAGVVVLAVAVPARGQFLETFDAPALRLDPSGVDGWAFFTGDGEATMDLVATGEGHASILVDARNDRRNVWWALIKHRVSQAIDVERLAAARLGAAGRGAGSNQPRPPPGQPPRQHPAHDRLPQPPHGVRHPGRQRLAHHQHDDPRLSGRCPGDTVFAQMALMDWGHDVYRVDVDYFKVDVVEAARAGPDLGEAVPYHPPVPDPAGFAQRGRRGRERGGRPRQPRRQPRRVVDRSTAAPGSAC